MSDITAGPVSPGPITPDDISVVIPTYNRSALAVRAIETAVGQTVPAAEVIVVDDGSTDDTPEVLAGYEAPVRIVRQENGGSSAARNRGVAEATRPWIAFLDSDDVWRPDHLEQSLAAMSATDGRADLYFADALTQFPDTMRAATSGERLFDVAGLVVDGPFELAEDGSDWAMLRFQPMLLQASLMRRSRYLELGGLRPELRLRHDLHFFFLLALGRPIVAMNHIGTEMTADDGDGRLSVTHGETTAQFAIETATLYADVINATPGLSAEHKADLQRRQAQAHLRLAKLAWDDHKLTELLAQTTRAGVASPGTLLRRATGRRA